MENLFGSAFLLSILETYEKSCIKYTVDFHCIVEAESEHPGTKPTVDAGLMYATSFRIQSLFFHT